MRLRAALVDRAGRPGASALCLCAALVPLLAACGGEGRPWLPDAAVSDAGVPDAGVPDAGAPDAGAPDAGLAANDGGAPSDAGMPPDGGTAAWDLDAAPIHAAAFPLGVQAGDVTPFSVVLWTWYTGTSALRLRVLAGGTGAQPIVYDVPAPPADGGFVHVDVGGLRPGTQYRYAFVEADGARSPAGRFRTAPPSSASLPVKFGATSCTHQRYAPFASLSHVAREDLDFFLLLGDTSYNDTAGDRSRDDFRMLWRQTLSARGYRDLLSATASYATWDDHEVIDNWDPETVDPVRLAIAREVFFEHLPIRRLSPPNENRIYRSFRWGRAVEVFVLDCRGERKPSTRFAQNAEYLSRAQMDWLKSGLAASNAVFKIIANSVPIANFPSAFDVLANDRWEGYEAQRAEILDYIVDRQLRGVVWVSGDFHLGAVARIESSGPRAAYYDILAGPGGQSGNPVTFLLRPPQFELATTTNNSVVFEADPTVDPPTLRIRFVDNDGNSFHEKTLTP